MMLTWLRRLGPMGLSLVFITVLASLAQAQDNVSDDEVNEVSSGLYCPVCESTPLDVCPTQACRDWRELIRDQLASGMTKEEIHDYFALQYGDQVLAEPPRRGFSLVVWLLPLLAVPAGAILFGRYIRAIRREAPVSAPDKTGTPEESTDLGTFIEQVEAELNHE